MMGDEEERHSSAAVPVRSPLPTVVSTKTPSPATVVVSVVTESEPLVELMVAPVDEVVDVPVTPPTSSVVSTNSPSMTVCTSSSSVMQPSVVTSTNIYLCLLYSHVFEWTNIIIVFFFNN